jgi:tripartite-type tricarboxylate transporter receptor subunit TctC
VNPGRSPSEITITSPALFGAAARAHHAAGVFHPPFDDKRLTVSTPTRRFTLIGLLALAAFNLPAQAQVPALIKLVVPYPPGGSVDTMARLLQQPLQEQLKTTVVVENKPGAGGRIAASQLKRDPADGSVVLIAPNALTTIQSLVYAEKIDYQVMNDFTPVARLAAYPLSLAVPASSPVRNLADLQAQVRQNPQAAAPRAPVAWRTSWAWPSARAPA